MSKPNRPIVLARAVIFNGEGKILLGKRLDNERWECPGGKVDDETILNAAIRETEEETGLLLDDRPLALGYVEHYGFFRPKQRYITFYFRWNNGWYTGEPGTPEGKHELWMWFDHRSLPTPISTTCQRVLNKIHGGRE